MASKNREGDDDERDHSNDKGGYECEFLKSPAKDFQGDCPVCLLVLREPHRVSCCGKAFCEECIGRLKKAKKRCPTCNATEFTSKLDTNIKASLSSVRVHCSNQKSGCDWVGSLGDLEGHLNLFPSSSDYRTDGCRFVGLVCVHCRKRYQRHHISEHESHDCSKRPYTCPTCQYKDTYNTIINTHWFDCQKLDLRLKAVEQSKSSGYSLWFIAILAAVCAMAFAGLLHTETLSNQNSSELVHTISLLQKELEIANNKLQQCVTTVASLETRLQHSVTEFERKLDNERKERRKEHTDVMAIIGEMKSHHHHHSSELVHTISLLQKELEIANNKLQQCVTTVASLETRLQHSVTEFERKLDNEQKEHRKEHTDVMAIIGEMKSHHHHHSSELVHTISLLQKELEIANNKLQQCVTTVASLETRLQHSVTEFERKLDNERKERRKEHTDVMAIIGEMKSHHHHHGHGNCHHKRGKHKHSRK